MSFDAKVYQVFIASPSDVDDERDTVEQAIAIWNATHAVHEKTVLLPVRWESHVSPALGNRAEEIILEVTRDCDVLVAVFGLRFGSKTGKAPSGTVEEIGEFIKLKRGSSVALYFSDRDVKLRNIDPKQLQKRNEFKKQTEGVFSEYKSLDDLRQKLVTDLHRHVRRLRKQKELSQLAPQLIGSSLTVRKVLGEQNAAATRGDFEKSLLQSRFRQFSLNDCTLAATVSPHFELETKLSAKQIAKNVSVYEEKLLPIGSPKGDIQYDHDCIFAASASGIIELSFNGTIRCCTIWDTDLHSAILPRHQFATDPPRGLIMHRNERAMLIGIRRYIELMRKAGITGPWYVGLSLFKPRTAETRQRAWEHANFYEHPAKPFINQDILTTLTPVSGDIQLDDLQQLPLALKAPINELWIGCGYPRASSFNEARTVYCGDYIAPERFQQPQK